jgi:hypothetical protein
VTDATDARERRLREAGLDQTIEDSFPASDPPSTNPDPIALDETRRGGDAERAQPAMPPIC